VNQCDDDEKKNEKEKNYKSVFKISLSTTIIEIIIVIIIIIIIIIKKNVNFYEDFDILFICFVEFFSSVSSLEEED
jgi:ABC-type phosphate transport system permease subunit